MDPPVLLVTQSSLRVSSTGLYGSASLLVKMLVIPLPCILSEISSGLSLSPVVVVTSRSSAASMRSMCWAVRKFMGRLVFFHDKTILRVISSEKLGALNTGLMVETSTQVELGK